MGSDQNSESMGADLLSVRVALEGLFSIDGEAVDLAYSHERLWRANFPNS